MMTCQDKTGWTFRWGDTPSLALFTRGVMRCYTGRQHGSGRPFFSVVGSAVSGHNDPWVERFYFGHILAFPKISIMRVKVSSRCFIFLVGLGLNDGGIASMEARLPSLVE